MRLTHFSISQQGDSHIAKGTNCQDFSGTASVTNEKLKMEMVVAAIADGVGRATFSEFGSKIAVTTALDELSRELATLEEVSEKTVPFLIHKAFDLANQNIEQDAEAKELPYLSFDTTLTVAVLTDSGKCYYGHIGDDGIVAMFSDGTYAMITARIEGEEANSVIPLSSERDWVFGVVNKPVAALALMTDGILDKSVGSERMKNRVYYPFFKPMFESVMEDEQDVLTLRAYWDEYLRDPEFRKGFSVTDDITLAIVQLPELLKTVTPAPFDNEKWDLETEEERENIEKQLEEISASRSRKADPNGPPTEHGASQSSAGGNAVVQEMSRESAEKPSNDSQKVETATGEVKIEAASAEQSPESAYSLPQNSNVSDTSPYKDEKPEPEENPKDLGTEEKNKTDILPETTQPIVCTEDVSKTQGQKEEVSKTSKRITMVLLILICITAAALAAVFYSYKLGISQGRQQMDSKLHSELVSVQQESDALRKEIALLLQGNTEAQEQEYQRGFEAGTEAILSQPVVSKGQNGDLVAVIQKKLNERGWDLKVDGKFGEFTAAAVSEFQTTIELSSTGEVDILTFLQLMKEPSKLKEQKN